MGRGTSKAGGATAPKKAPKTFDDRPKVEIRPWLKDPVYVSDVTYAGDGEEQEKWVAENTNNMELTKEIRALPPSGDPRDNGFFAWSEGRLMGTNIYDGFDQCSELEQKQRRLLDEYIDRSEIREPVTVARLSDMQLLFGKGKKTATLAEVQAMEGQTIFSKNNLSTAMAAEGLRITDDPKPIEYKITIPGGSKGAGMWLGSGLSTWGNSQREMIMNRDVYYKVGRAYEDKKRGIIICELEFEGREAHDYGKSGK